MGDARTAQLSTRDARVRYDLLAVDLDGTLLDSRGNVSAENAAAIARARGAGLAVAVCTGRSLVECRHVLEEIRQLDPVVVAGGSIIACPRTSRTLHRFGVDRELVAGLTRSLLAHRHPVRILKDPLEAGFDYLVVVGEERLSLDPVTRWWFEKLRVRVRIIERLSDDPHPKHTVRVGACGAATAMARIKGEVLADLGDRVLMHHFPAVVAPQHVRTDGESLHVLEIFSREATKWTAVRVLAERIGVAPERIAAIGDEINDVPMIRGAGLGIAMGNAIRDVHDAAGRRTLHHDEHGVAHAIDNILSGAW